MSDMTWEIKRAPFEEAEYQASHGDDATISVKAGRQVLPIAVSEVIESVGPKFVLAHVLQCVREGVWEPEDTWLVAGEISALAHALKTGKRKRKPDES